MASQVYAIDLAAGGTWTGATTVTAASITAMVPDIIIPAYALTIGSKIRATLFGKITTAASSPGTVTFQAVWGGTGGTVIGQSGSLAYVASASNIPFKIEYLITCTAIAAGGGSTTGTLFCQGWFYTTTAVYATPANAPIPASAPAAVGSLPFNTSENLDFSCTMSAATNSITTNLFTCESIGF